MNDKVSDSVLSSFDNLANDLNSQIDKTETESEVENKDISAIKKERRSFFEKHGAIISTITLVLSCAVVTLNFIVSNNINSAEKRLSAKTTYIYDELDSMNKQFKELSEAVHKTDRNSGEIFQEVSALKETLKQAVTKLKISSSEGDIPRQDADLQNINSALQLISKRFDLLESRVVEHCNKEEPETPSKPSEPKKKREGKYYIYSAAGN